MSLKRIANLCRDLLAIVGRVKLVLQLLTLTRASHGVLAFGGAIGIFAWAALRSDGVLASVMYAAILFLCVIVGSHYLFQANNRPRLTYDHITGTRFRLGSDQFGTEPGGFMWGLGFLQPVWVNISNAQRNVDVAANNVSAVIHYRHHDGRDKTSVKGSWTRPSRSGAEWVERIQIESGQTGQLVLVYDYPPTPNQSALGAKTTKDYLVGGNMTTESQLKRLGVGHWSVMIEITSDNSAPLLLEGGFTITKDERIEFDKPALRKLFS